MSRTALVFDLDGTLVDSLPDLQAALNQMLAEFGRLRLTAAEVRPMIGDGTRALVERALTAARESQDHPADYEAAHQKFLRTYQAAPARHSRLYRGVRETLDYFRGAGVALGICTNKPQAATVGVLESFGIRGYFNAVLGGDVVPFRKPDPRHVLAAIDQLGAATTAAAMIGDNENDYAAARAAGIPIILMRYGYLRVPPETLSPDAWLDDFGDVPAAIAHL